MGVSSSLFADVPMPIVQPIVAGCKNFHTTIDNMNLKKYNMFIR